MHATCDQPTSAPDDAALIRERARDRRHFSFPLARDRAVHVLQRHVLQAPCAMVDPPFQRARNSSKGACQLVTVVDRV